MTILELADEINEAIKQAIAKASIEAHKVACSDAFPPYLTKKEAATYLGISPQTLTEWMNNPRLKLPYKRIGRTIRFSREQLDLFMSK